MKARRHTPELEDHGIDLAPMLDFVLNLLIFFIITTSFVKDTGVTVVKPNATSAEHRDAGNILIAVRANGDVWMDRHAIDVRDVRAAIERLHVERPDDTVVIVADRNSHAATMARVMDAVRAGGIKQVSLAGIPRSGS